MNSATTMLPVDKVKALCLKALRSAGVPDEHAEIQLQLLLDAELRGVHSHGLLRLPRVIERIKNGVCDPNTQGQGTWKKTSFLAVDGNQGMGPVVAKHALELLEDRVQETGVAVAAVKNCDHLGMLAWYAEQAVHRNLVLIAMTISEALVHPWGGSRAMLGTNPIAIGVPAEPQPFVLDMATSLVSMGKIHDYANRGKSIPEGWAIDAHGRPTTDAEAAKDGAIAPFGGAKGYGLGLGFELLVTALAGSAIGPDVVGTLDSEHPCNKGDLFIVMHPLGAASKFINHYLQEIRKCPAIASGQPVRVPGERSREIRDQRKQGEIEIDSLVWEQISALAKG